MRLYLDTEFNGFRGALISMALISEDGDEFYEVVSGYWQQTCHPWVRKHVLPLLDKSPIPMADFKARFAEFMEKQARKGPLEIVADWPEDFVHFCHAMTGEQGGQVDIWPTFHLVQIETKPQLPHYAPSDARALRDACRRLAV